MTSLRVLQVAQKPQRRGAEIFAHHLSGELRRQGAVVRTAYLYPFVDESALALGPDDVVLGGREDHLAETRLGFHPTLLGRLRRTVREFRPDIVQVNGSRSVKYGALARRLDWRRWGLVYRNIGDPRQWVQSRAQRRFYRWAVMPSVDGIVGVSDETLSAVKAFYPLRVPTVRIPRALDLGAFKSERTREQVRDDTSSPHDAPVLLFVGSLTSEKRPDRLLRVLAAVQRQRPSTRLWVLGDGPKRNEFLQQCEEEHLGASVSLFGSRSDVADFMSAADVLVLTSDTEGVPGVALEAGASALPVVATRVGGVAECVVEGETGLLAEVTDEDGMAAAILSLIDCPTSRAAMGARAERWIRERFDLQVVALEYLAFYERVLATAGAGRAAQASRDGRSSRRPRARSPERG